MLVTVRWPGTRMAPISRTWACRQVCWRKSGAKHRITAAKRAGRRSMVAVLWLGRSSLAAYPLRRPSPHARTSASGSTKLAKVELSRDGAPLGAVLMPPEDGRDRATQILWWGLALGPARFDQRLQPHPVRVRQHRPLLNPGGAKRPSLQSVQA